MNSTDKSLFEKLELKKNYQELYKDSLEANKWERLKEKFGVGTFPSSPIVTEEEMDFIIESR